MAVFPASVKCVFGAYEEDRAPVVMRSEMERSVPKQRRMASDTLVQVKVSLQFDSVAHHDEFEHWFDTEIGSGSDWFDWKHPRTGVMVQARILGGVLGPIKPLHGTWRPGLQRCRRDTTIEYLMSAY